jgi:hypothetical protein
MDGAVNQSEVEIGGRIIDRHWRMDVFIFITTRNIKEDKRGYEWN